jgi:hypothetical protein
MVMVDDGSFHCSLPLRYGCAAVDHRPASSFSAVVYDKWLMMVTVLRGREESTCLLNAWVAANIVRSALIMHALPGALVLRSSFVKNI